MAVMADGTQIHKVIEGSTRSYAFSEYLVECGDITFKKEALDTSTTKPGAKTKMPGKGDNGSVDVTIFTDQAGAATMMTDFKAGTTSKHAFTFPTEADALDVMFDSFWSQFKIAGPGPGALLKATGTLEISGDTTPFSVVAPTAIALDGTTLALGIGDASQLTWAFTPVNAIDNLVFTSSDPTKATVSASGQIVGIAAGTATITVTTKTGNFTDTIDVTVS